MHTFIYYFFSVSGRCKALSFSKLWACRWPSLVLSLQIQELAFSGGTSRGTRGKHEGVEERQSDAGTLSSCPDCLSLSRAGTRKDIGYEKKRTLMQNISRMTTKALPRVPTSYRCHFRSLDKTQALLLTSGLKKTFLYPGVTHPLGSEDLSNKLARFLMWGHPWTTLWPSSLTVVQVLCIFFQF